MKGEFMDSTYVQTTSDLTLYQIIGTILFIIFIVIFILAIMKAVKFSKHKPGMNNNRRRTKFIELEKDFRWRRLKVAYLISSVLIILIVIGITYTQDTQAPLQTYQDFREERALERIGTIFGMIVTTLVLWGGYFVVLPFVYKFMVSIKGYLHNPDSKK